VARGFSCYCLFYYGWGYGALCELFHIIWQIVQPVQKKSAPLLGQIAPCRCQAASGEHLGYACYPELWGQQG
jgi:hypothetical protein